MSRSGGTSSTIVAASSGSLSLAPSPSPWCEGIPPRCGRGGAGGAGGAGVVWERRPVAEEEVEAAGLIEVVSRTGVEDGCGVPAVFFLRFFFERGTERKAERGHTLA